MSLKPDADVAVFDFDHTLCRFDSSAAFFYWLIRQQLWRLGLGVLLAPWVLPLLAFRLTRKWPVRIAVRLASVGRPIEALPALVERYLAQAEPNWAYPDGLDRLRWHQQQGDQVVIATGSLQVLVQHMLARAAIDDVLVVGSILSASNYGWTQTQHCIGKNKIPMLQAHGVSAPWAYAYSDHAVDLPMLRHAKTAFLINPSAKSMALVRARMAALQILHWP